MRKRLRPDLNLQTFCSPNLLARPRMSGLCWKANSNRVVEREAAGVRLGRDIALHSRFDRKRAPANEKKQAGDQAQRS